jgi:hypothetical protein
MMQNKKPAPIYDDPEQSRRFIEVAQEVGADGDVTDEAFGQIVRK